MLDPELSRRAARALRGLLLLPEDQALFAEKVETEWASSLIEAGLAAAAEGERRLVERSGQKLRIAG